MFGRRHFVALCEMLFRTVLVLLRCVGMFRVPAFEIEGLQPMLDFREVGIALSLHHHADFHLSAARQPLGGIEHPLGGVGVEHLREALAHHERRHADARSGDLQKIAAIGVHLFPPSRPAVIGVAGFMQM